MAVSLGISITQNSQSIANNTSNVTINVIAYWSGGSYNKNLDNHGVPTAGGWLSIDDTYYYFNNTFNDGRTSSGNKVIYSRTLDIEHDVEGKKKVYCSAYYRTGVSSGNITTSTHSVLDNIPRFAVLETAPNFNDEENPIITYSNPAGENITSIKACISLDGSNDDIIYRDISPVDTSYIFELTESERDILREATTDSNYRNVNFIIHSVIGGNEDYSSLTRTITIKNPNPIIDPVIADQNEVTIALTGDNTKLVKYFSIAEVTINASAVKKATLTSEKVTCGNKYLTGNGVVQDVESNEFIFSVSDSRGNITTKTITPPFVEYIKPSCSLANNIPDADGNMSVIVTGNYFNDSFGAVNNSLNVYYRFKPTSGSYSDWVMMTVTKDNNTYSATEELTGLDYQTAYTFQAYAEDVLCISYSTEKTVKATPVFDWGENDFRFNVPVSINGVDVRAKRCVVGQNSDSSDNPWYKYASVTASALTEDMRISFKVTFSYGSTTRFAILNVNIRTENASGANSFQRLEFESDTGLDASNFVLMHSGTGVGAVYELWVKLTAYRFCMFEVLSESSRIDYIDKWVLYDQISAGYAAEPTSDYTRVEATKPYLLNSWPIGSYYISANDTSPAELFGGTWHRIENRFLWGAPSTSTLGATAGEMTHTLTTDEMPSHSHGFEYSTDNYTTWNPMNNIGRPGSYADDTYLASGNSVAAYASYNARIKAQGGGEAHNNMPPYVTVAIWRREA